MPTVRYAGLFMLCMMSAGCAVAPKKPEWPADMPPRSYYESRYTEDLDNQQDQSLQKYLKWVKVFYAGWGGVRGWRSIRAEILADVDAAERERLREGLDDLGKRISGEWAKAYGRRVIDSRMVQVWINAAYEASARREHRRLLNRISRDVDALLAGKLEPGVVSLNRYYPDAAQPPPFDSLDMDSSQ